VNSGLIDIVVPAARAPQANSTLAPRLDTLRGQRVGFRIEGSTEIRGGSLYQNFEFMATRLQAHLTRRYQIEAFPRLASTWNPETAPRAYDDFVEQSHAAILGIAG
jgi:hypothetical protein